MAQHQPFGTITCAITEQPGRMHRFRYMSEIFVMNKRNRAVAPIKGATSSQANRTYPTIQIHGYEGPFLVRLSLVNACNDLVHPHSLKSLNQHYKCSNGVIYLFTDKPRVEFSDVGIVRPRGKTEDGVEVKRILEIRRDTHIDPLKAGFAHINDHSLIDLSAVRLCFEVFLPGKSWTQADAHAQVIEKYDGGVLPPVTSSIIYDEKKHSDLKIVYFAGPVLGGKEMHLWCNKYTGLDPDVVFNDGVGWSQNAYNVVCHKRVAMRFEPPRYKEVKATNPQIKVEVRLRQTSQSQLTIHSNPVYAEYIWRNPRLTPPDYLGNMSAKNVDGIIEECRALVQSLQPKSKSHEGSCAKPSTSRTSESSDLTHSLPDYSVMSKCYDSDGIASNVSTDSHLHNRYYSGPYEPPSNADYLLSTTNFEYGSNAVVPSEECGPFNEEHITSILEFDDRFL